MLSLFYNEWKSDHESFHSRFTKKKKSNEMEGHKCLCYAFAMCMFYFQSYIGAAGLASDLNWSNNLWCFSVGNLTNLISVTAFWYPRISSQWGLILVFTNYNCIFTPLYTLCVFTFAIILSCACVFPFHCTLFRTLEVVQTAYVLMLLARRSEE